MHSTGSCDGLSGTDVNPGSRPSSQAHDSTAAPLPPALIAAIKQPSSLARDSSSPHVCYSGGTEGNGGLGGSGKYSPIPAVGSAGFTYHLNPTTLAMLQQHNYIPYFRGIKAHRDWGLVSHRQRTTLWSISFWGFYLQNNAQIFFKNKSQQ